MLLAETKREGKVRYYAFSPALLTKLRKAKGWNQVQLAEASGVSQGAISLYESGKREPDNEALKRLGRAFTVYFVSDWGGIHGEEKDPLSD